MKKALIFLLATILLFSTQTVLANTNNDNPYQLITTSVGRNSLITDGNGKTFEDKYPSAYIGAISCMNFDEKIDGLITIQSKDHNDITISSSQLDWSEIYVYEISQYGLTAEDCALAWQLLTDINGEETLVYESRVTDNIPTIYTPIVLCGPSKVTYRAVSKDDKVVYEIPLDGESLLYQDSFGPHLTQNGGKIYIGVKDIYSREKQTSVLFEKIPQTRKDDRGEFELISTYSITFEDAPKYSDKNGETVQSIRIFRAAPTTSPSYSLYALPFNERPDDPSFRKIEKPYKSEPDIETIWTNQLDYDNLYQYRIYINDFPSEMFLESFLFYDKKGEEEVNIFEFSSSNAYSLEAFTPLPIYCRGLDEEGNIVFDILLSTENTFPIEVPYLLGNDTLLLEVEIQNFYDRTTDEFSSFE